MAKKQQVINATFLQEALIKQTIQANNFPSSVAQFCNELKLNEQEFYSHFPNLEALASSIIFTFFTKSLSHISSDEHYQNYSATEKTLSFYFSVFECFKNRRSYILLTSKLNNKPLNHPFGFSSFKIEFEKFIAEIIEGTELTSIQILDRYVPKAFWLQFVFVFNFWLKDTSENFEDSDAAIEKAVTLSFQLLPQNTLTGLLDFGKFLFHHKDKLSF